MPTIRDVTLAFLVTVCICAVVFIGSVVFAPEFTNRLLNHCEPVTLRDACACHKAGTVIGELCLHPIGQGSVFMGAPNVTGWDKCPLAGPTLPGA
jgi:hypothetical protein